MLLIILSINTALAEPVSIAATALAVQYGPKLVEWLRTKAAEAEANRPNQLVQACMAEWGLTSALEVTRTSMDTQGNNIRTMIKQCAATPFPWTGSNFDVSVFVDVEASYLPNSPWGADSVSIVGFTCEQARITYEMNGMDMVVDVSKNSISDFTGKRIDPPSEVASLLETSTAVNEAITLRMAAAVHPKSATLAGVECRR